MVGYPDRGCHVRLDRIFLENDPLRIVTAGRPLFHLHQYACPGGGHLRVHPRLFRPDSRTGRFHSTRTQVPDEPCFQQQCQHQCDSAGYQRTRTLTDGNSRKTIGCREKRDSGTCIRSTAVHLRRTPRRYAGTVCTTSSQPGKTGGTPADLHAKGQRKPYIPDGGREPEIHQAGNAHRDRPRQGFFAGRQYPQHRPDIAVCTERAAHGVFLYER